MGKANERIFGEIDGFPENSTFGSRNELSKATVHKPLQAGISGSETEGADSIVLSGGYEDDQDYGDIIIYTGYGGRDNKTGKQISHQTLTRQNLALVVNRKSGLPIRVVRGSNHVSAFSPQEGYRYDGLYFVEDHWRERGRSGYLVWRFRLVRCQANIFIPPSFQKSKNIYPVRITSINTRLLRDTKQSRRIKELYDYRCQICHVRLEGNAGPYAEAAHIKPLGTPHNGPDTLDNLLCLCPNHHVLLDYGGFAIDNNFSLIGIPGYLHIHPIHKLNVEYCSYHREHYGYDAEVG